MLVTAWLNLHWQNELVSWDPGSIGGINRVDFDIEDQLWVPDLGYIVLIVFLEIYGDSYDIVS